MYAIILMNMHRRVHSSSLADDAAIFDENLSTNQNRFRYHVGPTSPEVVYCQPVLDCRYVIIYILELKPNSTLKYGVHILTCKMVANVRRPSHFKVCEAELFVQTAKPCTLRGVNQVEAEVNLYGSCTKSMHF